MSKVGNAIRIDCLYKRIFPSVWLNDDILTGFYWSFLVRRQSKEKDRKS